MLRLTKMSEMKDLLFITFLTLVQSSVSSAASKGYCDSPNLPMGRLMVKAILLAGQGLSLVCLGSL